MTTENLVEVNVLLPVFMLSGMRGGLVCFQTDVSAFAFWHSFSPR